jgi:integrase
VTEVISFLHTRFQLGLKPATIKSYISALGKYLPDFDGQSLGKHRAVIAYLAGARNANPSVRSVVPPWSLDLVLDHLNSAPFEPMASASLKSWTLKTVFLLALASAARVSELTALDVRPPFTVVRQGYVTLMHHAEFKPKVPSASNIQRRINLQALDSLSCPVRAIRHYLALTGKLRRPPCTQLFVSFAPGREGKPVQKNSISSWIVQAILSAYHSAGLPLPKVAAHSTRKVSTSRAWAAGASCEELCLAATWSSGLTFANFYKLDMPPAHLSSISSRVLSSTVTRQSSSDNSGDDF